MEAAMRVSALHCHAALLFSCAIEFASAATSCSVSSPPQRAALVELYTSEGCNSCPPADNWLSALDQTRNTKAVVPLALHVDYWDNLGWKDRFAQPTFTSRQQHLSAHGGKHVVYTPEVFVGGQELRSWSNEETFATRVHQLNAESPLVEIHIDAHAVPSGNMAFDAAFKATERLPEDAVAYMAIYENRVESPVKAGENTGVTLHHNRVVRRWIGPVNFVNGRATISGGYSTDAGRSGLVAFVESPATGEVLQVVELSSCGG
ncbi:DUF1223 domain-containing protein [Caballeronia humi]